MNTIDLCKSQEDYIKVIRRISKRNHGGWVSNSEIADELRIKPSSVTNMLYKLKELKMITWSPRKSIRLTEKGKRIAKKLDERYKALFNFFNNLFPSENHEAMKKFCCEIEHSIPPEIYRQISKLNQNYELRNQYIISVKK